MSVNWFLELKDGRWPIVPTKTDLPFNGDLLCEVSDHPYQVVAEYVKHWETHGCRGSKPFLVMEVA